MQARSKTHPLDSAEMNERAEQVILDAMMSGRVAVGHITDRRLFRYMVIRQWVNAAAPHVIMPEGLKLMSESVRAYPTGDEEGNA